jgi:hypothetical protein
LMIRRRLARGVDSEESASRTTNLLDVREDIGFPTVPQCPDYVYASYLDVKSIGPLMPMMKSKSAEASEVIFQVRPSHMI